MVTRLELLRPLVTATPRARSTLDCPSWLVTYGPLAASSATLFGFPAVAPLESVAPPESKRGDWSIGGTQTSSFPLFPGHPSATPLRARDTESSKSR
jgi:hypothetical protein